MCSLLPASARAQHGTRPAQPHGRSASSTGMVRGYDRGLELGVPPPVPDAARRRSALIVLTGCALRRRSPRASFPSRTPASSSARPRRARTSPSRRCRRSTNQFVDNRRARIPAVSGVVGFAGATGGNSSENTARMFIQLKPFERARRHRRSRSSSGCGPKVAQVQGAKFFMQAGQDVTVGGRLSRTAISIHPHRHRHRRAQPLGADHRSSAMSKLPELQDVASDQQIASPHIADRRSTATPPRGSASRSSADRRDALRRLRPAPGRDDLHLDQPVQGDPRGRSRNSRRTRRRCRSIYVATRRRRAGAAQHRRAFHAPRSSR